MNTRVFSALAILTLITGCAELRKHQGASFENNQDVLVGGPISGIRIKDLPPAVRGTLKQRVPTAEIADIDKQTKDGRVIYKIAFIEPAKDPTMYISEDGTVAQGFQK